MTRDKAIDRILKDIGLNHNLEDYVLQTIGRLGCDDDIDLETVFAIEEVIRRELNN